MVTPLAEVTVTPLGFEQAALRMVLRDGEPWWVLNDVCGILGHTNPRKAAAGLWDWQKGVHSMDTLGGRQDVSIVNEAGIYKLVLNSRMPGAEQFERWLTYEVLPSIRKHGCYPPPPAQPLPAIDTETPWDGQSKTLGQRFREERLRWEADVGHPFADTLPMFSKASVRAIEDDRGGIFKRERIRYLAHRGFDVHYILNGTRAVTDGEKRLLSAYRAADPVARAHLFETALALPGRTDPE